MKVSTKKVTLGVLFLLFIVFLHLSGIKKYINLTTLAHHKSYLVSLVENQYIFSVIAYILLIMTVVACSLPIAAVLTIVGGYMFGALPAAIYVNIGATAGSVISFLLFRYLVGSVVQTRYHNQLQTFNQEFEQSGSSYLLLIHFITIFPLFLVNILASLTRVSLWDFVWTTSCGIFPASLVFAFAGRQLGHINSISDIFTWQIVSAFLLLTTLGLMPVILKKLKILT